MQHPSPTRSTAFVVALSAWLCLVADVQAVGKDMNWLVGKPISTVRSTLLADGWLPQETALTRAKGAPDTKSRSKI